MIEAVEAKRSPRSLRFLLDRWDSYDALLDLVADERRESLFIMSQNYLAIPAEQSCEARKLANGSRYSHQPSTAPSSAHKSRNRDALLLRSALSPGNLQSHCDGCGQKFSVRRAHACKNGGLVISRHNEIRDKLLNSNAFIPSAVRDGPRIHASRPAEKKTDLEQPNPSIIRNFHKNRGEDRGDSLIRGLWARGTDCIIDARVTRHKCQVQSLQRP
jgi:hypothetical protein